MATGPLPLIAQLETLAELAPYLALLVAGFVIGAWGQAAKAPLVVALGIVLVMLAIVLFQLQVEELPDLPSGL